MDELETQLRGMSGTLQEFKHTQQAAEPHEPELKASRTTGSSKAGKRKAEGRVSVASAKVPEEQRESNDHSLRRV